MAVVATLLVPAAAISQGKKAAAAVPEAARKTGMAEAPAVVQAAGIPCQVSDARLIGEDKKAKSKYFEVACGPGAMGFVLQSPAGGTPTAFTCVEANTGRDGKPPTAPCLLPANADPKPAVQAMIQKANVSCLPERVRGIGQSPESAYMEVACQGGVGYVVIAKLPFNSTVAPTVQNCLMYDEADSNIKCTLSDQAARLAIVDQIAAKAANGCAVKERRFAGMSKDGGSYYEAACQDGKGYMYKVASADSAVTATECSKAEQLLGGCKLTDAREAQSEQAALYTRIAKGAGSNCEVDRYALFQSKPGEETAELACKDGRGAILTSKGAKSQILDCGRAPVVGYKCSLSKDTGYAALTTDVKKFKSDTSCVVSDSRVVGKTSSGNTYVEVACADKLKGYVIEYQSQPSVTPISVTGCVLAGNCKLPGNV
jgi:hypothetical protein